MYSPGTSTSADGEARSCSGDIGVVVGIQRRSALACKIRSDFAEGCCFFLGDCPCPGAPAAVSFSSKCQDPANANMLLLAFGRFEASHGLLRCEGVLLMLRRVTKSSSNFVFGVWLPL